MVLFKDDPEKYNSPEMFLNVQNNITHVLDQVRQINKMEEEIILNPMVGSIVRLLVICYLFKFHLAVCEKGSWQPGWWPNVAAPKDFLGVRFGIKTNRELLVMFPLLQWSHRLMIPLPQNHQQPAAIISTLIQSPTPFTRTCRSREALGPKADVSCSPYSFSYHNNKLRSYCKFEDEHAILNKLCINLWLSQGSLSRIWLTHKLYVSILQR